MSQTRKETAITRVTIELGRGIEISLYPASQVCQVVARWPDGQIRTVESYSIGAFIELLGELRLEMQQ